MARLIANNWKSIDQETKVYVETVALLLKKHYVETNDDRKRPLDETNEDNRKRPPETTEDKEQTRGPLKKRPPKT